MPLSPQQTPLVTAFESLKNIGSKINPDSGAAIGRTLVSPAVGVAQGAADVAREGAKGIGDSLYTIADSTAQSASKLGTGLGQGAEGFLHGTARGISDVGTIGIKGLGEGTGAALGDIGTGLGQGVTNAAKGAVPGAMIAVVIILAVGLAIGVSGAGKKVSLS